MASPEDWPRSKNGVIVPHFDQRHRLSKRDLVQKAIIYRLVCGD
jgi:hypothetical protein